MSEHIATQDPPLHTRTRGLLNKLITPKRLNENEDFMWRLADQQLDKFVGKWGMRIPGGLREAVFPLGHCRSSWRAGGGPRRVPCRLRG